MNQINSQPSSKLSAGQSLSKKASSSLAKGEQALGGESNFMDMLEGQISQGQMVDGQMIDGQIGNAGDVKQLMKMLEGNPALEGEVSAALADGKTPADILAQMTQKLSQKSLLNGKHHSQLLSSQQMGNHQTMPLGKEITSPLISSDKMLENLEANPDLDVSVENKNEDIKKFEKSLDKNSLSAEGQVPGDDFLMNKKIMQGKVNPHQSNTLKDLVKNQSGFLKFPRSNAEVMDIKNKALNSANNNLTENLADKNLAMNASGAQGLESIILAQGNNQFNESAVSEQAAKVLDLGKINLSQNRDYVINQISNYIIRHQVEANPTIELKVTHEELGRIDITVSRNDMNQIDIKIGADNINSKLFFEQNSKQLLEHLNSSGIKVADLSIDWAASTNMISQQATSNQLSSSLSMNMGSSDSSSKQFKDENNNNNNQEQSSFNQKQGSGQSQERSSSDSERRKQLWKNAYREELT